MIKTTELNLYLEYKGIYNTKYLKKKSHTEPNGNKKYCSIYILTYQCCRLVKITDTTSRKCHLKKQAPS